MDEAEKQRDQFFHNVNDEAQATIAAIAASDDHPRRKGQAIASIMRVVDLIGDEWPKKIN